MNRDYISFFIIAVVCILIRIKICHGLGLPTSDFIPFSEIDGNSRFRFGDDNALSVPFSAPFSFFNKTYWSTFISGNGLVSFGTANPSSSTGDSCQVTNFPMIMPFWADANEGVDPESSKLTYMESTNSAYLNKVTTDIHRAFPQHRRISVTWMFIVTWSNLASHGSTRNSARNTFQLILSTSNGLYSFVLFYYNQISWSNRNAVAGFDFGGDTGRRYKIPGSCSASIEVIEDASNFGSPGKWAFQVNRDVVHPSPSASLASADDCDKGKSSLRIEPPVVSVMGNIPLFVHGLCLKESAVVTCSYQDKGQSRSQQIKAVILRNVVVCPVPFLYSLGKMALDILVSYPDQNPTIYKTYVFVVKEYEFSDLPSIQVAKMGHFSVLSAQWDPSLLSMAGIRNAATLSNDSSSTAAEKVAVNHCPIHSGTVQIVILEFNGKKWKNLGSIIPPILNNGVHMSPLNMSLVNTLIPREGKILVRTFAIQAQHTLSSGESLYKIFPSNSLLGTANLTEFTFVQQESSTENSTNFVKACQSWYNNEPNLNLDVLPCPPTVEQARVDLRFVIEKSEHAQILNEQASVVYMQRVPSPSGAGSQCAYDDDGRLLIWLPGCGRVFRRSPNNWNFYWRHFLEDILPYMFCCKWASSTITTEEDNCYKYMEKRPTEYGENYIAPRPARAVGDPHITTFDGRSYTFNGAGEYWLIKYNNGEKDYHVVDEFKMQMRLEPFSSNASVITAVVMEEVKPENDVTVQVELTKFGNKKGLLVLVDGEPLNVYEHLENNNDEDENIPKNDSPWNFQSEFTLYHSGVIISQSSYSEILISFSSGFSFNFKAVVDGESDNEVAINIVGSAGANLPNKFEGLFGNFDGDAENDFLRPDSTLLQGNVTMEGIHREFGMEWIVEERETLFKYQPGRSYAYFHQPDFSPWLLSQEELNDLEALDQDFCEDFQDCIFDYLATGSSEIAKATKGASILFQEMDEISKKVVKQCEHVSPPANGYLIGSSYVVGSTITAICKANYTLNQSEAKYTCSFQNTNDTNSSPVWLSSTGQTFHSSLLCESIEEKAAGYVQTTTKIASQTEATAKIEIQTKTTQKIERRTEATRKIERQTEATRKIASQTEATQKFERPTEVTRRVDKETTPARRIIGSGSRNIKRDKILVEAVNPPTARLSSSDTSSSAEGTWIFLVGLIVFTIIAIVVIVEYPPCNPVRRFFTDKYYRYRVTNTNDNDERIDLS